MWSVIYDWRSCDSTGYSQTSCATRTCLCKEVIYNRGFLFSLISRTCRASCCFALIHNLYMMYNRTLTSKRSYNTYFISFSKGKLHHICILTDLHISKIKCNCIYIYFYLFQTLPRNYKCIIRLLCVWRSL